MELKVGMYVRTEKGIIFRYYPCKNTEYDKENNIYHEWDDWGEYDDYYIITKASENIIDLIEVGDFINGYRILEIADMKNAEEKVFTVHRSDFKSTCKIWNEQDIETILTHERYEENCYKTTTKQQT